MVRDDALGGKLHTRANREYVYELTAIAFLANQRVSRSFHPDTTTRMRVAITECGLIASSQQGALQGIPHHAFLTQQAVDAVLIVTLIGKFIGQFQ